jgi:transglutaminase-like putative cysteine protease
LTCLSCGRETIAGERFCEWCGKPLGLDNTRTALPRRQNRLRTALAAVSVIVFLVVVALVGWRAHGDRETPVVGPTDNGRRGEFAGGANATSATSAQIPTVAAPCPEQDNMLALEGYAPGAGGAEHIGQKSGGLFGAIVQGGSGTTSEPSAEPASMCRALTQDVEDAFRAIDAAAQTLPSDGFDEAVRGRELADPGAIFAFVRDGVRTQAYGGAMRGGVGTLMNRGGSPTDKILLLAELLGTQGIPVRFVHAALSDADIARVIGAVLGAPAPVIASAAPRLPAGTIEKFTEGTTSAQPIADQIVAVLKSAAVTLAASDAGLRSRWSANVRDHWWLQAQQDGKWVDLDPTLSNTAAGSHLGPAPSDAPADQLSDTLYTTITFRITGDFADRGTVTTRPLAEQRVRAADAYAQPIVVQVGDPDASLETLAKSTSFVASVSGGGATSTSDPFQPDPDSGARLLRMRLEIETDRPGYPPLLARRSIIDRSAAGGTAVAERWDAKRTAYALTTTYDGLALSGELDPAFVASREIEATHAFHALLEYAINRRLDVLPRDANQIYPIEVMHYLALDSMVRHATEAESTNHTRFYFDRPAIAFMRHAMQLNGANVVARNEFDVVDDAMDATGANVNAAVRDNVLRGVLDDAIEANVSIPKGSITTRTLFAAAARSGIPIIALRPSASAAPLPPAAVAAATASLQRGAIVAIARSVSVGGKDHAAWWEVDPGSGSTIGRTESGAGQAMTEFVTQSGIALKANTLADVVGGFDTCMFADVNEALAKSNGKGLAMLSGCGQEVACEFAEGQAVGVFADWLYGSDVATNLSDLTNSILKLASKMCG